jgi:Tfp pilus assembly protein PilF
MKKVILAIATLGVTIPGIAQDKYVVGALTALQNKNYEEAKEDIDKAMASPETKEKPKALFAKAQVYGTLQSIDKYKSTNPYREGGVALLKLVEVKPDYEKNNVDQMLLGVAYATFNDGVKAFNEKKYDEAADLMRTVVKVHDLSGGKRFEKHQMSKQFDTIAADANLSIANSAFYAGKYEEAIPLLLKVKNDGIRKSASVYECLIDAYTKQKKSAEALAMIDEARKTYPSDITIRNYELNYYITAGKQEELVKKLEDAAASEPNNADIQFNLATIYLGLMSPKDGKKPANAAELSTKSENAFQAAIRLAPENAVYNYNYGAMYFNQATDYNDQMNAISGTSAAEQKKYDELKAKRDGLFGKSTPYFEKAYTVFSAQNNLKGEDMKTFKGTLIALKEVYARQNKMDKSMEMKKKFDTLN